MKRLKTERFLLIVFILIFSVVLLPSFVKRLLPAPKVVETLPVMSSTNVPVETQQVKFVFNQPMAEEKHLIFRGMRVKGKPKWADEHRKVLVLELTESLKPGAFYSIVLNNGANGHEQPAGLMKGRWGKLLDEYTLTFMTEPSEILQKQIDAFNSGILRDTDQDGLDDALEVELGTLSTTADTDADGLTDYEEYCKYQTDPTLVDSDGDGKPDTDWDERREYAYSIRAVLELKPPWDISAMNDLFQDARLMADAETRAYSKVEVVVYPYATPVLLPMRYPYQLPSETIRKYTEPTYDLNYSTEMQMEVKRLLSGVGHTLDAIAQLHHEIGQMELTTPLYAPFVYTYKHQGRLLTDWSFFDSMDMDREVTESEVQEALNVNYFGDSMFKRKQYGACISRSRLFASMLRAAGIPARVSMSVPMLYYYKGGNEWNRLVKNVNNEAVAGSYAYDQPLIPAEVTIVGHSQVEVYLNNHWIRLGYQLNEGPIFAGTDLVFIKIIDAADFTEIDFTKTWAPAQWVKERPYRTVELSDQDAKYESHSSY